MYKYTILISTITKIIYSTRNAVQTDKITNVDINVEKKTMFSHILLKKNFRGQLPIFFSLVLKL